MRLFAYYALHTFKNALRKLFKTWVAVFLLVCLVLGGLIGLGAGLLSDLADKQNGPAPESPSEAVSEVLPEQAEESLSDALGDLAATADTARTFEAVGALVILVVFLFNIYTSHSGGSKIFTMADVNLLFSAPLKPQSILLFKLISKMGSLLVASIYLVFQIPNLVLNVGLPISMVWLLLGTWFLTLVFGQLLSVLLYTLSSTHERLQKNVKNLVYGVMALLVASFLLHWHGGDAAPFPAAVAYLSSPWMRYIPIWGWMKAMVYYGACGHYTYVLAFAAALVLAGAALIYIIWHLKADFYEDAMASSEEMAAKLRDVQEGAKVAISSRKKDRSDNLVRDGLHRGWGASVYFHKAMYNRFRFAKLGYFTPTCITYTVVAVLVAVLCRYVLQTGSAVPVIAVLAVMVFFRALGDPLAQDTQQDHFVLIPDSAFKKVMYSLLGGGVNCLLDLLPGLILGCIITGGDPLTAALWVVLIVSVDLYASSVGAFITLSLPTNLPKTIRQLIQILFIYFGLIPVAGIVAVGLVTRQFMLFSLIALVFDLAFTALFTGLCPRFIVKGRK